MVVLAIVTLVPLAPGWEAVKKSFFNAEVFAQTFPRLVQAFLWDIAIFLWSVPLITIIALAIALEGVSLMNNVWVVVASNTRCRIFAQHKHNGPLEELEDLVHPEGRLHERRLASDRPGRTFDRAGEGRRVSARSPRGTQIAWSKSMRFFC